MHLIKLVGGPFDGESRAFTNAFPVILENVIEPEEINTLEPYRDVPPRPSTRVKTHKYVLRWLLDGSMWYEHVGAEGMF